MPLGAAPSNEFSAPGWPGVLFGSVGKKRESTESYSSGFTSEMID